MEEVLATHPGLIDYIMPTTQEALTSSPMTEKLLSEIYEQYMQPRKEVNLCQAM
ncbi:MULTISPECIES: hypothetical protein [Archaeoglobus]|jgi:hypothetical protein|uniref:hypothetical protein n=1 Tax=Archaeoglobus TaxID=2233 RepID=UPI0012DD430B|nr:MULTISPECIES: hypothetical protein [Archaeoglobus]